MELDGRELFSLFFGYSLILWIVFHSTLILLESTVFPFPCSCPWLQLAPEAVFFKLPFTREVAVRLLTSILNVQRQQRHSLF